MHLTFDIHVLATDAMKKKKKKANTGYEAEFTMLSVPSVISVYFSFCSGCRTMLTTTRQEI